MCLPINSFCTPFSQHSDSKVIWFKLIISWTGWKDQVRGKLRIYLANARCMNGAGVREEEGEENDFMQEQEVNFWLKAHELELLFDSLLIIMMMAAVVVLDTSIGNRVHWHRHKQKEISEQRGWGWQVSAEGPDGGNGRQGDARMMMRGSEMEKRIMMSVRCRYNDQTGMIGQGSRAREN